MEIVPALAQLLALPGNAILALGTVGLAVVSALIFFRVAQDERRLRRAKSQSR